MENLDSQLDMLVAVATAVDRAVRDACRYGLAVDDLLDDDTVGDMRVGAAWAIFRTSMDRLDALLHDPETLRRWKPEVIG